MPPHAATRNRPHLRQPFRLIDDIGVLKVQGNVYMLVTATGNIAAQEGDDGILVVNTGTEAFAPQVAAALKNTGREADSVGGQYRCRIPLTSAATTRCRASVVSPKRQQPRIVAYENVLDRVSHRQPRVPDALWPNDEYFSPTKDFSFNGEAIEVYHVPNALTDGDSMVHFRRSDVLATGDVFTPGRYPVIHTDQGGTIQGELDALNQILRITVPLKYEEAGTYVIPGRGRLCDEADVVEYRNMVTIVRDRIRALAAKDNTLEQVRAARPTRDYDTQYDKASADAFVEAIFKTVANKK